MNDEQLAAVSRTQIFLAFLYIGATSFGGGVVAYLREHLVARRRWLDEDEFLAVLEIGETVPGLISTNVAVLVGSRLGGVTGAIAAAMGMIIPGAAAVSVLGVLYVRFRGDADVAAALAGVAAAAVGLVLAVTLQIGKREMKRITDLLILATVFVLVGMLHVSLVPVLVLIAPIAIWTYHPADNTEKPAQPPVAHGDLSAQHRKQPDDPAKGAS